MAVNKNVRVGLIKGIFLPYSDIQHIIRQYVDDTSFIVKTNEQSVDNLVEICTSLDLILDWRLIIPRAWHI